MKKLLLILLISSGCAITYETPKCELMLREEPCLTDRRCCNIPKTYQASKNWRWWYWKKPTHTKTIIMQNNNKPYNKPNKPNRPNRKFNKNKKR